MKLEMDEGLRAYWLKHLKMLEELVDEDRARLFDLWEESHEVFPVNTPLQVLTDEEVAKLNKNYIQVVAVEKDFLGGIGIDATAD